VVEKLECVGHVQMCLGSGLHSLKRLRKTLGDGRHIGGKGSLTDKRIDKSLSQKDHQKEQVQS